MKTIAGYIVLTCKFHREGKQWVGENEELGVSSFGSSFEDANESLKELVVLHLNTLERLGERDRVFAENHIKVRSVKPKNPVSLNISAQSDHFVTPCVYPIQTRELQVA
ncbi:MAG: hypothetical protein PHE50_09175 [Dehalococcoidales bacterium]|nr:hypothetical protein [Dehalococcoidales bacterium]